MPLSCAPVGLLFLFYFLLLFSWGCGPSKQSPKPKSFLSAQKMKHLYITAVLLSYTHGRQMVAAENIFNPPVEHLLPILFFFYHLFTFFFRGFWGKRAKPGVLAPPTNTAALYIELRRDLGFGFCSRTSRHNSNSKHAITKFFQRGPPYSTFLLVLVRCIRPLRHIFTPGTISCHSPPGPIRIFLLHMWCNLCVVYAEHIDCCGGLRVEKQKNIILEAILRAYYLKWTYLSWLDFSKWANTLYQRKYNTKYEVYYNHSHNMQTFTCWLLAMMSEYEVLLFTKYIHRLKYEEIHGTPPSLFFSPKRRRSMCSKFFSFIFNFEWTATSHSSIPILCLFVLSRAY